jgi:hypothetical protein
LDAQKYGQFYKDEQNQPWRNLQGNINNETVIPSVLGFQSMDRDAALLLRQGW